MVGRHRLGVYRVAHRRSAEQAHVMGMPAVRDGLVRTRTRWINIVRALLRRAGIEVRSGAGESFVSRVEELDLPVVLKDLIRPCWP